MKKFNYFILMIILTLLLATQSNLFAKEKEKDESRKPQLVKTTVNPSQSLIDINNITSWVTDAGFHDWIVASSWNGAYPNGYSVGAIFAEGLVWGGQVFDGSTPVVRVGGNTYGSGTSPIDRLYRVRPDYATGNVTLDAADFNNIALGAVTDADIQALRDQYEIDWNEWPADRGAPYEDVNGDGSYDPTVDIPGIPGASQTIFITYNDNISSTLYGSPPIGLEVTETHWAYAYSGALGNVIYKKVDIVYVGTPTAASNSRIDSLYIVQWSDVDVGSSTDDYAGCDTTLNLGYAYSSTTPDATYEAVGLAPPAAGYDFLQGVSKFTGDPNDSAIFNLQWRKGYKYVNPVPMSAYSYFAAGGTWSDPGFNYNGTLEFYNLMRGYLPIPRYPSASPFPTSVADVTPDGRTYLLTGDPVAGTGKIDGVVDGPGDRRIMVTNGPVTLSLGDTAEVVVALVAGLGTDNLSSITNMKVNDITAQIVFDQLFQLPSLPLPDVKVAELDRRIVLNWGHNQESINSIETFSDQGYDFEGYQVIQLPSSSSTLEDGVVLATYDLINDVASIYDTLVDPNGTLIPTLIIDGKNTGLQRYLVVDTDPFRRTPLRNGQDYYLAVVAYANNPQPKLPFHALRSPFVVLSVTPHTPDPGNRYGGSTGDTLAVVHDGPSQGNVIPLVVDPTMLTGHDYTVTFKAVEGTIMWDVNDVTNDEVVAADQVNQTGNEEYLVTDGLLVKVTGPPLLGLDWDATGERWLSGGVDSEGELMFGAAYLGGNFWGGPESGETQVAPGDLVSLHIDVFQVESYDDANGNGAYDLGEIYTVAPDGGQMASLYTTWGAGNWEATAMIPFKVYDTDNDRQLTVVVRDRDANGQWDPDNGEEPRYNYFFVLDTDYDPTGDNWNPNVGGRDFMDEILVDGGPVQWVFWWGPRGSRELFANDFSMDFIAPKVNTSSDVFSFTAPSNSSSNSLAKDDVKNINVFPNPYYGTQYRETSRNQHYVTFSHLPGDAVIRIFDLSGVLVRTITHVPSSGQFERWNLQNDSNYPVASGIYIVYIDMPGLGATKVLKLAVIQEQQILRVY